MAGDPVNRGGRRQPETVRGGRVVEFEQITDTVPQLDATRK